MMSTAGAIGRARHGQTSTAGRINAVLESVIHTRAKSIRRWLICGVYTTGRVAAAAAADAEAKSIRTDGRTDARWSRRREKIANRCSGGARRRWPRLHAAGVCWSWQSRRVWTWLMAVVVATAVQPGLASRCRSTHACRENILVVACWTCFLVILRTIINQLFVDACSRPSLQVFFAREVAIQKQNRKKDHICISGLGLCRFRLAHESNYDCPPSVIFRGFR